jgi:hypothetical protein
MSSCSSCRRRPARPLILHDELTDHLGISREVRHFRPTEDGGVAFVNWPRPLHAARARHVAEPVA